MEETGESTFDVIRLPPRAVLPEEKQSDSANDNRRAEPDGVRVLLKAEISRIENRRDKFSVMTQKAITYIKRPSIECERIPANYEDDAADDTQDLLP